MKRKVAWYTWGMALACIASSDLAQAQLRLSTSQVFDIAQQQADSGNIDRAIDLLEVVTQDINPDYRAEARVRIARYLVIKGDKRAAIRRYGELLDEMPRAGAVRIELALLLASMGEESAAAREFRRAEAVGLPPEVLRAIHSAADIFWNRRPVGFDLSVGIAPDSNINSATSSDKVTIFGLPFQLSDDAVARSGIGLTFDANITIRRPSNRLGRLIIQMGTAGRVYRDSRFNDATISSNIGPELVLDPRIRIRPSLLIGRRFFGTAKLYDFYGVSGVAQMNAGRAAQFTLSGTLTDFKYSLPRKAQSGRAATMSIAYDRAISSRLSAQLALTGARTTALDRQFSTTSISGTVTASRDMGHWTLWSRVGYSWLSGDTNYGFFYVPREDRIVQTDVGLIFRRLVIIGLSPQIRASYIHASSSIPLFRYNRLRSEFSLAKSF